MKLEKATAKEWLFFMSYLVIWSFLDFFDFQFDYMIAYIAFDKTIIINKHIDFNFIITNWTIVNNIN
ncbi:MAG: hypothetical protein EOO44_15400 [Flavobacterium sp.]|nr:MAG: hypothetical protein EOO44_15400 [Flavobacterium sp.]